MRAQAPPTTSSCSAPTCSRRRCWTQGATTRSLYLPRGRWVDLWRSAVYRAGPGRIDLRRARVLRGKRSVTVPAPLEQLPLMVRAGAVIAMLPAGVDTLAPYGRHVRGLDRLADVRDRLRLLAFPRGRSSSSLERGETLRSGEGPDGWTLELRGKAKRHYELDASLATLRRPLVPCSVELDGEPLNRSRWSFDRKRGVLHVRFAARRATLSVRPCL